MMLRLVLLVVIPLVAAVAGLEYYIVGTRYVTTENAYVKATVVAVSAEVTGRIEQVLVRENARVKSGDLLFSLDPEPFRIAFQKAGAELGRVRTQIEALRADHRQARIELKEAEADIPFYRRAFDRQRALAGKGHSSRARYDEAERNLANSRQRAGALRQKSLRILAGLGGRADLPIEAHPNYLGARAARDEAELNLRRTMVYAPLTGIVGPVRIENGEYISVGMPALPIISDAAHWVEANLKETQLTEIRIGQSATVVVDAFPGRILRATVDSISPSTGSEFAILPPQNASGNWVKVVQRVSVRLRLAPINPPLQLRSGMTTTISIDTEIVNSLGELIGSALAWKAADK